MSGHDWGRWSLGDGGGELEVERWRWGEWGERRPGCIPYRSSVLHKVDHSTSKKKTRLQTSASQSRGIHNPPNERFPSAL